jgi:DNA-binding NarL/FixJ family response regulator
MAGIRILIVDDIAGVRHELHTLLELSGRAQVVGEAADGAQAVRLAAQLRPDVVLMDLEMPVLDGYAAARLVKGILPGCRVIALSIHEDAAARQKALEAGVDVFVSKASHLQELLDAIRAAGASSDSIDIHEGERS